MEQLSAHRLPTRQTLLCVTPLLLLTGLFLYNLSHLVSLSALTPLSAPDQQVASVNVLLLGIILLWLIAMRRHLQRLIAQLHRTTETLLHGRHGTAGRCSAASPSDMLGRLGNTLIQLQRLFASEHQHFLQEQARNHAMLKQATDGILFVAADGHLLTVNPATEKLSGYTARELIGRPLSHLLPDQPDSLNQQHWQSLDHRQNHGKEIQLRCKDGSWLSAEFKLSRLGEFQSYQYLITLSDLTSYKEAQACIDFLAYYDPLTGLPNRILLLDRLTHAIQLGKRAQSALALLFIDLDHFKDINNSLGFNGGDALLKQVASRIGQQLRDEDSLARLEGDRFVIVQENLASPAATGRLAQRLLHIFKQAFSLQQHSLLVTPSIGIALHPQHAMEAEQLLKAAEIAMQQAKCQGRNRSCHYEPLFARHAQQRMTLEQRLRQALLREEFMLCYQPQINLRDNTVVSLEALVRWRSREHGLVAPDAFLPNLAELHLLPQLTRWLLRTACRQLQQWHQAGYLQPLSVTLDVQDLQQEGLADLLQNTLQAHQLDSQALALNLPEAVLPDPSTSLQNTLDSLIAQGITLNLDNFGIGRVPFDQLQRCGIHSVRLERTFTRQLPADPYSRELSASLLRIAHQLGLRVIAEGVETAQQYHYLRQQGYDWAQGFLICRPLTSEQLETFLQAQEHLKTFTPRLSSIESSRKKA